MEEEKYMRRCIQLAQNGLCNAAPNPMVGAVVVCDGKLSVKDIMYVAVKRMPRSMQSALSRSLHC